MSFSLPAVAKLNLFLHITGRRADGYHNLQTLFQMLDYGDRLHFKADNSGEITLSCSDPSLNGSDNLIYRAAQLLKPFAPAAAGCQLYLEKNLPMGGGLGGGSSDAATTLHGLNKLWQLGLSTQHLAELGLRLGADVPVFVHGTTAFAEGVGERLQAVELPEKIYLVVTPHCHISTAAIFSHPQLKRDTPTMVLADLMQRNWQNDCQPLVEQLYPIVAMTLQWLLEYAPCRMTGTGASVFAEFPDAASAQHALANLPASCQGFIARGVNQSPLWAALTDTDSNS
ncbi:4-(cytidine 5'-diphospho)-2-C-methyl-D-erythritol kinase [Rheinheimera sp. UJ63]|uniref:4-(cytidine 5'-diphospho)-2-C-methyl-D-erythritol kinase n=1 Tax=Rheinheimera sp. UJ63 TaxID=2910157 RepID=UPI001F31DAB2|nr:4-(cytidine 5'-diphospho)-2-C-methyl-D-erythritol kinase [Rheinheimera sp. UJ63]MCF4008132.1 4-(cytidine 5'-diphospho)-2-C-methyl-D-erythritol kinase [Rheinheimera sp. UJ63]